MLSHKELTTINFCQCCIKCTHYFDSFLLLKGLLFLFPSQCLWWGLAHVGTGELLVFPILSDRWGEGVLTDDYMWEEGERPMTQVMGKDWDMGLAGHMTLSVAVATGVPTAWRRWTSGRWIDSLALRISRFCGCQLLFGLWIGTMRSNWLRGRWRSALPFLSYPYSRQTL